MKISVPVCRMIFVAVFAACLCSCMATPELKTGSGMSMELGKAAHLVSVVALSPDGRYAATRSLTPSRRVPDTVMLWDLAAGAAVKEFKGPEYTHSGCLGAYTIQDVAFSPDSRYLAIGGKGIRVWDISAGTETITFGGKVWSFAFSPDGRQILTLLENGSYLLFDFETGREIKRFKSGDGVTSTFSPDGRYFIGPYKDAPFSPYYVGKVSLWDISKDAVKSTTQKNIGMPISAAFSPDGKSALMGGYRNDIVSLFDIPSLAETRTFKVRSSSMHNSVQAVAFSPDGKFALTGGNDGYIEIWDAATGIVARAFQAHLGGPWLINEGVASLAVSPDGRHIISSGDASTKVWDFATGNLIATLVTFADGEWIVTTPNGYYNASAKGDQYLKVTVGDKQYTTEQLRESFYRPDLVKLAMTGGSLREFRKLADVKQPPVVTIVNTPTKVTKDEVAINLNIADSGGGVGDIRLYLNGSAVMLDNTRDIKVVSKSGGISRTYTLKLSNGLNTIRAIAFNGDNTMQSSDATCQITASFLGQARPSLYAVVVGINEYKNPKLQLKSAVADAELFARTLKTAASGFFEKVSIKTLTTVEATTSESIINKLKGLRALNPDDLFVFYVASHGTVDDGEYYLIPSNVGSTRTEKLKTDAISQTVFKELIANIPATKKLIVLDTCNSGALGDAIQTAMLTRGMSEDTAMKILGRAVGSTILSAATSVQDAIEGYQGHGLFTYVLAEGLSGKADKGKTGYIKTTDLADYVDSEVPLLAEKVFKKAQYPSISINGQGFPIGKTQ